MVCPSCLFGFVAFAGLGSGRPWLVVCRLRCPVFGRVASRRLPLLFPLRLCPFALAFPRCSSLAAFSLRAFPSRRLGAFRAFGSGGAPFRLALVGGAAFGCRCRFAFRCCLRASCRGWFACWGVFPLGLVWVLRGFSRGGGVPCPAFFFMRKLGIRN